MEQSNMLECDIPEGLTLVEWRRLKDADGKRKRRFKFRRWLRRRLDV